MYGHGNNISIIRVSNGYILQLPQDPAAYAIPVQENRYPPEEEIRRQARIFQDEILGDPQLKSLIDKKEHTEESQQPDVSYKQEQFPCDNNVYIFKDLTELLEFLKERYI